MSGFGFSLQTLTIKKLAETSEYKATFQLICARGVVQMFVSLYFIKKYNKETNTELFGPTPFVRRMLCIRSFVGFGGICFAFLALEHLPLGDTTVLVMISPIFATIFSYFALGEPWRLPEVIATVMSIGGVIFVAQPEFIFGSGTALAPIGVLFGVIASVSAGAAYTCVRILGTTAKMPWWNVCFAQSLGQIFASIPLMFIIKENRELPDLFELFVIISIGFVGSWSQIAMTVGMQREKSATATGMRMSDVFFGFIWQVLFTRDNKLSLLSIFGAMLVMGSIFVLIVLKPKADDIAKSTQQQSIELSSNYNVLQTAERDSVDASTRIDISMHNTDEDADIETEDSSAEVLNDFNPFNNMDKLSTTFPPSPTSAEIRKRQGSLGNDPSVSNVGLESVKSKLRQALE